jgi:hypothetical protein
MIQFENLIIRKLQWFKICGLWVVILFSSNQIFAQEIVFRSTLNKNKVVIGETFQISFTLENADGRNFTPPSFNDFYIVGGPSQAMNTQIINGSLTRAISFSYFLQPKKEGTFIIYPATIEVSGRTLKSNSVSVVVNKSNAGEGNREPTIAEQISENVFVRIIVDKDECYQGEQITATIKFYNRLQLSRGLDFKKEPEFNGFWAQEIESVKDQFHYSTEVYKGVQFNVATLRKIALFPQRFGELEIDPIELATMVRVQVKGQQRSMWDDFFGNFKDVPHHMVSNNAIIKVKPLPSANKPNDFSGVAGNFKMDVKLDKTETNVDDPITLSIKISGDGNVKMIEKPSFELPKDFDVFDPKTNESVTKRGNIVTGYKTFDFLLIPRRPGEFKVPSFSFNYFDLNKKEYVRHTSPEYTIKVTGQASSASSQSVTGIKKEEVELLGEDIRFIHLNTTLKEKDQRFFGTPAFIGLCVTPFILFFGLLIYKKRDDELKGNKTLLKRIQANKVATKRMAEAKKALAAGEKKKFYDETAKAIWGYLSDKLNMQPQNLPKKILLPN